MMPNNIHSYEQTIVKRVQRQPQGERSREQTGALSKPPITPFKRLVGTLFPKRAAH